jgi:hypothetical protein
MQSQSVQTWTGCSETISLAGMMPLEERPHVPVLSEESPLRVGLPASEPVMHWKPNTSEDLNIVRIEESGLPAPSLASLHAWDYSVSTTASPIEMGPDHSFNSRVAQGLWTTVSPAPENEPEALRVSPEAPTEVKYRIWMQPMQECPPPQLESAADRPCPPTRLPGLEAWTTALDHSSPADEVRRPEVNGFAVQGAVEGLVTRVGTPLQSVARLPSAQLECLLYPGSRRMPKAGSLTIG